jgi:hypothetical protein
LKNTPADIKIVRIDAIPGLPKKWDLGDWEEGCGVDVELELSNAESLGSFELICREWVYVSQQDAFYNLVDRNLIWSSTSFDRTYSRFDDKTGTPSKKFLRSLETVKVDDLDFVPGAETILVAPTGKKFLNEWFPSENYIRAHEIAEDKSISDEVIAQNAKFFIEHIQRISNGEIVEPELDPTSGVEIAGTRGRLLSDAVTWHFSQLVKRPMDKRGWIPLMVSENNGTGKTYFVKLIGEILGSNRTVSINTREFQGDYQDWADGCLFYELAEVKSIDSTDVYDLLKKYHNYKPFTEDMMGDRMKNVSLLNVKTKAKKKQRDFLNAYITSNHLFPMALANSSGQEGSDRRLLVIHCEKILSEKETENLFDIELKQKAAWVGAYLIRFEPKFKWNPSWAPITAHKRLMLEKDRARTEARETRADLGKNNEFYETLRWMMAEKIGIFGKKVLTTLQIRSFCEANRIKIPAKRDDFQRILAKLGFHAGPVIEFQKREHQVYVSDPTIIKDEKRIREELNRSIEG